MLIFIPSSIKTSVIIVLTERATLSLRILKSNLTSQAFLPGLFPGESDREEALTTQPQLEQSLKNYG
jgi:hypothetical protein